MKFNKNYVLRIESNDFGTIEVKPPFSMNFDIKRNVLSSANVASISIYNLAENTRNQIRKDQMDYGLFKQITLDAGYGDNLAQLLNANVIQAYSSRNGVDLITSIEAFEGGFAYNNARINKSYTAGTPQRSIVVDMIKSLKDHGVDTGSVGDIKGKTGRGNSYAGNTIEILRELTGGAFYIDNGKANVLGDNEVIEGDIKVIDARSGLLGTPRREQSFLTFDMVFEPMLQVGQKIELRSQTEKNYNGTYKIVSLHHKGMISEVVSGQSITTVGLFYGTQNLKTISGEFG